MNTLILLGLVLKINGIYIEFIDFKFQQNLRIEFKICNEIIFLDQWLGSY